MNELNDLRRSLIYRLYLKYMKIQPLSTDFLMMLGYGDVDTPESEGIEGAVVIPIVTLLDSQTVDSVVMSARAEVSVGDLEDFKVAMNLTGPESAFIQTTVETWLPNTIVVVRDTVTGAVKSTVLINGTQLPSKAIDSVAEVIKPDVEVADYLVHYKAVNSMALQAGSDFVENLPMSYTSKTVNPIALRLEAHPRFVYFIRTKVVNPLTNAIKMKEDIEGYDINSKVVDSIAVRVWVNGPFASLMDFDVVKEVLAPESAPAKAKTGVGFTSVLAEVLTGYIRVLKALVSAIPEIQCDTLLRNLESNSVELDGEGLYELIALVGLIRRSTLLDYANVRLSTLGSKSLSDLEFVDVQ